MRCCLCGLDSDSFTLFSAEKWICEGCMGRLRFWILRDVGLESK